MTADPKVLDISSFSQTSLSATYSKPWNHDISPHHFNEKVRQAVNQPMPIVTTRESLLVYTVGNGKQPRVERLGRLPSHFNCKWRCPSRGKRVSVEKRSQRGVGKPVRSRASRYHSRNQRRTVRPACNRLKRFLRKQRLRKVRR